MFDAWHKERHEVEQLLNTIWNQFLHQFPQVTEDERKRMDAHIKTLLSLDGYKLKFNKYWKHSFNKEKRISYPIFTYRVVAHVDNEVFTHSISESFKNTKIHHEKIAKDLETTITELFTLHPNTFRLSPSIHTHPNIKQIVYDIDGTNVRIGIQTALSKETLDGLASNPILDAYINDVNRGHLSLITLTSSTTSTEKRCARMKDYYEKSQYKDHLEFVHIPGHMGPVVCNLEMYKFTKEQEKEIFE